MCAGNEGDNHNGEGGGSLGLKGRTHAPSPGRVVPRTSPSKLKIMRYLKYTIIAKSKFTTILYINKGNEKNVPHKIKNSNLRMSMPCNMTPDIHRRRKSRNVRGSLLH